jgi:predicted alpha/beta hydrolase family esterase
VKQALILHGTSASPASNWFTWLKGHLEADGYRVWLPQLPHSDQPNTQIYNQFLLANTDFSFNEQTIMVGHSSGAVAALNLLQHLSPNQKIKAAFLVSAFKDDLGWEALTDLFIEPLDFKTIKAKAGQFIFLHADNDPYCPLQHAEYLAQQVGGQLILKPGQGHFNTEISENYTAFPELLEIIQQRTANE